MSRTTPAPRSASTRLVILGVMLLSLLIFLAWTRLRHSPPVQTASRTEPGASARGAKELRREGGRQSASGLAAARSIAGQRRVQRVLQYGSGEGELGLVLGRDQPPVGPESFAVARDGSILVADVVNQRVVIYSSEGAYLRSIDLPGIALGDIITDNQDRLYVYDQVRRALHQYDADGTPRSALELNPKDIDTRGYFHIAGNAVYFADAAARDVLVAAVQDGLLVPPDESTERQAPGIHAESGRIYSLSLEKGQAARLEVWDPPEALSDGRSLEIPLPGIVSARFLGEDDTQRFYVQTERLEGDRVVLEVLTFSAAGERLAVTLMPENDYAIWTAKLVNVRGDGTLVQFLPQQEQARLNLFAD